MTVLLRFRDLKAHGIVNSWPMLKRRIERDGFPPGRMIGPNTRTWTEDEVDRWYEARPVAGPELRGAAKTKRQRKAATRDHHHGLNFGDSPAGCGWPVCAPEDERKERAG